MGQRGGHGTARGVWDSEEGMGQRGGYDCPLMIPNHSQSGYTPVPRPYSRDGKMFSSIVEVMLGSISVYRVIGVRFGLAGKSACDIVGVAGIPARYLALFAESPTVPVVFPVVFLVIGARGVVPNSVLPQSQDLPYQISRQKFETRDYEIDETPPCR